MINIIDKRKCCGCTACYNACPQRCIEMESDAEGFLYPIVDESKCINCGMCDKVCPIKKLVEPNKYVRKAYAVRSKEREVVKNSTSGGMFTPIANQLFANDGIIFAAAFDDDFDVKHLRLDGNYLAIKKDYSKFRGSKYVQSALGECFHIIYEELQKGKTVCFIGLPCQVQGLKAYLMKDYSNLITIDFACLGVPSPKLWRKYIDYQRERHNSGIREISFRNKTYGYHSSTMKILFDNGKVYYGSARVDYMLKCFYKKISLRPSCYACPFKQVERCSDLTMYDCWHIDELTKGAVEDDDMGYTNIIVHSEKGSNLLKDLEKSVYIYSTDMEEAVKLDGIMIENSAILHPRRDEFYKELETRELSEHMQLFVPVSKTDYLIEFMKSLLYRFRLLGAVKKLKR